MLLREGFAYVFRIDPGGNDLAKVTLTKVGTGRRSGERIEVSGLDENAQVVASGAGFLADGDTVRIVATEFSILRATSVSICAGAAPGSEAVTVTVGRSMSMNC